MRFSVHRDYRRHLYYVLDNEDGAVVSARLEYRKACELAAYLNREDGKDA